MIVEYIRYQAPDQGTSAQLLKGYREAGSSLQASGHCLAYELTQCKDDPRSIYFALEWDSAEGHMQGIRSSPEFKRFYVAVQPFVGMIQEMRHYRLTGVAYRR